MTTHPVDEFLACVSSAQMPRCTAFAPDVVLDATVPNWRFAAHGARAVGEEFSRWYADPGTFDQISRIPIPDGEIVEFTLSWEERGIPHAAHQIHVLSVSDGAISGDRVWCGGRWPASLLAEMEEANRS